ncbi:hypothetical protein ACJMK2_026708 [Sinanodonta woodiana]|uniref:ZP domain-containing protein n=1 Tax=Sinanodonta woodiana TaxID=1069815 RepID=A0ABD3XKR8_SINWO
MYASGVIGSEPSQPCDVHAANATTVGYKIRFIISKCDLEFPIQVTTTTAKEDKNIIGGKEAHGFEIKCNGVFEGGENVTLMQTVLSKDRDFNVQHQELADPKMAIRDKNGIMLIDRALVLIGDELSVLISTSGNFNFSVTSCEAQSDSDRDRKLLINNGIEEDPSLLTKFNYSTDGMRNYAEAKLFAFHFVNSDHLKLTCVIYVCRRTDPTCRIRQKRNAPDSVGNFSPMTESLEANFVVVDGGPFKPFGNSGANSNNGTSIINVVVVALVILASYC